MGLRRQFPTDRESLLALIDKSRNGAPLICNNTTAERAMIHNPGAAIPLPANDDSVMIRYHGHGIVTLHADDTVTLNDCEWRTSTTKERLNIFAPWRVRIWQENHQWYFSTADNENPRPWPGRMRFNPDGTIYDPECPSCGVPFSDPMHKRVHAHSYNEDGHIAYLAHK